MIPRPWGLTGLARTHWRFEGTLSAFGVLERSDSVPIVVRCQQRMRPSYLAEWVARSCLATPQFPDRVANEKWHSRHSVTRRVNIVAVRENMLSETDHRANSTARRQVFYGKIDVFEGATFCDQTLEVEPVCLVEADHARHIVE